MSQTTKHWEITVLSQEIRCHKLSLNQIQNWHLLAISGIKWFNISNLMIIFWLSSSPWWLNSQLLLLCLWPKEMASIRTKTYFINIKKIQLMLQKCLFINWCLLLENSTMIVFNVTDRPKPRATKITLAMSTCGT